MDDEEFGKNPLAPVGLLLSILGGPLGLIVSFLALRRADRTGEGRRMAIAGLTLSAIWITIAVFTLAALVNPGDGPTAGDAVAVEATGTTVTVNPEVADETTPPSAPLITSSELSALAHDSATVRGKTFTVSGRAVSDGTETDDVIAAVTAPGDDVRVILRGPLVGDIEHDEDFQATVTVTDTKVIGLPVLQVSDLDIP
ncbi:DUF4190 domain-containing protein [Actinoplanes sp. NPDC026619]|uniref:DUF4190 domain-containing protein n=1 Tax=Actinoplanes sp. NPDC026619 TaxID=3155798 RepID=UPI00340D4052